MALSGSLQTNVETKYNSYGRYYILSWTATQSIASNTSEITWTLSAASSQVSGAWVAERTLIAVIDGETVVSKSNRVERYPGVIASGKKTLTHNSDGTRSFAISINAAAYSSEITCSASGTATLNTIARASDLTVGDGTLGSALTITASRKSSGFTHTVSWKCGSNSGTIASKSTATSWSFTPAVSLASNAPNSTQVECEISLTTYNGSAEVGTVKKVIHLSIPSSVKPSCTLTLSDSAGYAATYGGYVKGKSKIKAVVTASGAHGSTIKSYSVSANGSSYSASNITTDVVKTVGANTVSAAVTDSRGRSGSASGSVNVIDYAEPRITKLSVERCNADGSSNQSGSYVKITYSFSIYPLSNKNGKTITLKYKKTSASSYTSVALTSSYSATNATKVFAADDGSSYDVQLVVTDSFGSSVRSTSVSTAAAMMHWLHDGDGMGIGKVAEEAGVMDVGWSAKFRKALTAYTDVWLQKGYNICHSYAGSGQSGYICIAQINVISTYVNHPICFTVSRRGDITPTLLSIIFSNVNSNDPALDCFLAFGKNINAALVKSATSTWQLYVQKANSYDDIAILDVAMNISYMSGSVAITYPNTFASTVPSGTGVTRAVQFNTGSVSFWDGVIALNKSGSIDANGAVYAGNANASRIVVQSLDDRARILMQKKVNNAWTNPACGAYIDLKEDEVQTNKKLYVGDSIESASTIKGAELEASGAVTAHSGIENFHATPYVDFHFSNSTADYTARIIEGTKGILTAFNSIASASDKRLKKAIQDIPDVYMELVERLYPKLYRYKKADSHLNAGFIAQDVLQAERELGITKSVLVRGTGRRIPDPNDPTKTIIDYFSIDYQALAVLEMAYFMRKIKEQQEEIDNLKERLERIEKIRADAVSEE